MITYRTWYAANLEFACQIEILKNHVACFRVYTIGLDDLLVFIFIKPRLNILTTAFALLLLCVLGIKVISPAIGNAKPIKEIGATTGESEEKTNSEKQADNPEDFNKEKILSVNFVQQSLISTDTVDASFSAYINNYLPSHHFTILSPPPDFYPVLKS